MELETTELNKQITVWNTSAEKIIKNKLNISKDLSKQILNFTKFTNLLKNKEGMYTTISKNM